MDLLDLPERYRLILCDLWGCVHDGWRVFDGVPATLATWKAQQRLVLFVTNAPRTADAIRVQLEKLGLDEDLDDGIITAGEAGAAALLGRKVGFCGTHDDRADLERRGLTFTSHGFTELACAGLAEGETVADYADRLAAWAADDVLLHCLNPDRIVHHQGEVMVCAGALADAYEALGGRTRWYGKPYPTIYEYALRLAGITDKSHVLAIGDGLQTDMAGAAGFGIDAVFVTGGIHAGDDPVFEGGWRPVASVEGLGTDAAART
ncbi:HAD-IIA family hydrolase [Sphingomonas astaxanthinifaciens]|uniref:Haloacid dehalogenase n=1 Tax=Sphingomonas astaxanthinifaciens DSM 22298 TaxID=1123267 RepID=A0ABQ5Z4W8_9SPHN|nr:HAD-IIA family hydrolase [Sphingomonas astaxanthinifaciens]GLR47040.1 haloacid dehalogenase [Sphingomonas astaxanthinifaciens DSM 22298]